MNKRIYSLDALKFFSAIFIIFHHYQQDIGVVFTGPNFFGEGTWYGFLVELFFMISGFLAVKGWKTTDKIEFRDYYLKKCVRIYPMHFLATGTYCILWWLYCMLIKRWYSEHMVGLWNALASLLLISHGGVVTDIEEAANNPIWYLCVLLICYSVFWGINKFSAKYKVTIEYLFTAMVLCGIAIINYQISMPFFNCYTARGYRSFFLGALIACVLEKCSKRRKCYLENGAFLVLVVIWAVTAFRVDTLFDNVPMILNFIVYPSVLVLFTESEWIKKVFSSRIWGELGGISFEMYIWHDVLILLMLLIVRKTQFAIEFSDYRVMLAFSIGVILISTVLYYFVEKPVTAYWKKKLMNKEV